MRMSGKGDLLKAAGVVFGRRHFLGSAAALGAATMGVSACSGDARGAEQNETPEVEYVPNGGQTYMPFQDNIRVPTLAFEPLLPPDPAYPPLELNDEAKAKGYVIDTQAQHFLPGVEARMMDWWWANMEKGYYLWAPGAHKRFSWVRSPGTYGFLHSAHMISEAMVPGKPVFGGSGVQINRLGLDWFFFTSHLSHVIVEGVFNAKDEFVDSTVHMWEDAEGGLIHITAAVVNTRCSEPPAFVLEDPTAMPEPADRAHHAEYEAAMWPKFLPTLYRLWEGHPDPSQNVQCDLTVAEGRSGLYYPAENGPVKL